MRFSRLLESRAHLRAEAKPSDTRSSYLKMGRVLIERPTELGVYSPVTSFEFRVVRLIALYFPFPRYRIPLNFNVSYAMPTTLCVQCAGLTIGWSSSGFPIQTCMIEALCLRYSENIINVWYTRNRYHNNHRMRPRSQCLSRSSAASRQRRPRYSTSNSSASQTRTRPVHRL